MRRMALLFAVLFAVALPAGAQSAKIGSACTKAQHGNSSSGTLTCARTGAATFAWVETLPAGKGFKDGQWLVGSEVAPGQYRSPGANGGLVVLCIVTAFDKAGTPGAQEVSDGVDKPILISVKESAYKVTVSGCKPFVKIG